MATILNQCSLTSATSAPSSTTHVQAVAAAGPPLHGGNSSVENLDWNWMNSFYHDSMHVWAAHSSSSSFGFVSSAAQLGIGLTTPSSHNHVFTPNFAPDVAPSSSSSRNNFNRNGQRGGLGSFPRGHLPHGNFHHQGYGANQGTPADPSIYTNFPRPISVRPSLYEQHFDRRFIMSGQQFVTPYVYPDVLPFALAPFQLQVTSPFDPQLNDRILKQIEHYFSYENLIKDLFLRSNMDVEGWVSIELIATFNKVKLLTNDLCVILDALKPSDVVEVQGEKVRRRNDWEKWLLPPSFAITSVLRSASSESMPSSNH